MLQETIADAVTTSAPVILTDQDTVFAAAEAMRDHQVGLVVVHENGQPAGLVTDRDLSRRIVAQGLAPRNVLLRDVMTREMVIVSVGDTVETALDLMAERNLRHLPLEDEGELVAVLNINELFAAAQDPGLRDGTDTSMAQSKATTNVGDVFPKYPLVTVSGDATVATLAKLFQSRGIGAVAVVDGCVLAGMVSERDIVTGLIAAGYDADTTLVHQIMTEDAKSVRFDTKCEDALRQMQDGGFRHMPVMIQDAPVGMVSIRDLRDYVTKAASTDRPVPEAPKQRA